MGHTIQVFVAKTELLQEIAGSLKNAHIIELTQGFALMPITDELYDEVSGNDEAESTMPYKEFYRLSAALARLGMEHSFKGAIAYFETEYFGGVGEQAAILWAQGKIIFGPIQSEAAGPISEALRLMGVSRGESFDEFDAIGLGRFRDNDKWIAQPNYRGDIS